MEQTAPQQQKASNSTVVPSLCTEVSVWKELIKPSLKRMKHARVTGMQPPTPFVESNTTMEATPPPAEMDGDKTLTPPSYEPLAIEPRVILDSNVQDTNELSKSQSMGPEVLPGEECSGPSTMDSLFCEPVRVGGLPLQFNFRCIKVVNVKPGLLDWSLFITGNPAIAVGPVLSLHRNDTCATADTYNIFIDNVVWAIVNLPAHHILINLSKACRQ